MFKEEGSCEAAEHARACFPCVAGACLRRLIRCALSCPGRVRVAAHRIASIPHHSSHYLTVMMPQQHQNIIMQHNIAPGPETSVIVTQIPWRGGGSQLQWARRDGAGQAPASVRLSGMRWTRTMESKTPACQQRAFTGQQGCCERAFEQHPNMQYDDQHHAAATRGGLTLVQLPVDLRKAMRQHAKGL